MNAFSTMDGDLESALAPWPGNEVVQLREWGTDRIYRLPEPPVENWFVGRSALCAVWLGNPRVLPQHAELFHDGQQWHLRGLSRTAWLREDGEPRREVALAPGVEVGIGAATLVAENRGLRLLRAFCARLLGWGADRMPAVDQALRAIRLAAAQRAPLLLRGEGDLVPIAYGLHRHTFGDHAPFVVCDRRRRTTSGSVRSPANQRSCIAAFEAAAGGSLCVRARRPPPDLPEVIPRLYAPDSQVQLVVCLDRRTLDGLLPGPPPIELPPLGLREIELARIVDEYAQDAIAELRAPAGCFTEGDREWVLAHAAQSLPEIEKATRRVIAAKVSGNLSQAAGRLGMAPVSLVRWRRRRGLS